MKTAISLPDEVYERATRRAVELGMSRSKLFSRAVGHYLDELDGDTLAGRIDAALNGIGQGVDDSGTAAAASGRAFLAQLDDDW